ncbi:selenocysteine insertion sequence-binding protein 2-like isoform X2 [Scyliorhinus canicula]|uniref:selenocysteine insertion sequence-binding protein 2-like isoform X2 n=1 Tax=Scyliorhinus canicula TaxID=7830 RepID=UPI0018F6A215|nr:selenocysteine insertion sequence-binding protein 2-like isoform X2 [Scyliorhinus canicula]
MAERGSGPATAKGTRLSADVEPFVPKQQVIGAKWYESSPATLPRYLTTCYPFVQDPYVDRVHTSENGCNNLSQNFSELHSSYPDVSSRLSADYSLRYAYKQSSDSSLNLYAQTPLHCDDNCFSKHKYGGRGNKKKQLGQQDSTKEKPFLIQSSKETRTRKEWRNRGQNVNEAPEAGIGEQLQQPDAFGDNAAKGEDKQPNRCQNSKSKPIQKIQNESEPQTAITPEVVLSDFPVLQSPIMKQSSCDLRNSRVSSKVCEQSAKIWPSDVTTDMLFFGGPEVHTSTPEKPSPADSIDESLGTTQLPGLSNTSVKCSVPDSMTVTASTVAPPASSSSTATPSALSWARIVSQAPKKPVLSSAPPKISTRNVSQSNDDETKLKEAAGKVKKKKKKKKAKEPTAASEPNESKIIVQELPRFEDDEEFPDLASAIGSSDKANNVGQDKLFSHKQVTKPLLKPSLDEELVFSVANSHAIGGEQKLDLDQKPVQSLRKESFQEYVSSSPQKKAVEAPKKSGKKSKAPMQLDFGDMLAVLEQKQQEKKSKHTPKPIVLAVGGMFPLVSKETTASKRQPQNSGQEKVPHNPLDSSAPLVKRGKQREVPKAKKPTSLKKIILKEREERKQRRLLEEKGLNPSGCTIFSQALALDQDVNLDTQNGTAELNEDLANSAPSSPCQNLQPLSEKNSEGTCTESILMNPSRPKIHSRRFREYCSQVLSKEVDNYVTDLLKELVRFQDRLYQKDPIKAKKKRRIVMGLREVLKHLKLKKLKCVIISPNCERIQSKGGLDDALHTIIEVAREQEIPFVFALNRRALGRCVNKAVPVSVVGIFSYDGAENQFHQMIELTEEARNAYQDMLNSLEQELTAGEENSAEPLCNLTEDSTVALDRVTSQSFSEASEPEYVTTWKNLLKRQCNPNHSEAENTETSETLHCDSEEESGDSMQKFPKSVLDFECQAAIR